MGISIKNDRLEELVRELAELEQLGITEAIARAVEDRLERAHKKRVDDREARDARLDAVVKEYRGRPVYDDRDHGDMLYDDHGLPK